MGYITPEYYRETYKGTPIPDDSELETLIERASDLIDELTRNKIQFAGGLDAWADLSAFPAIFRAAVMKSVAAETEYLYQNGGAPAALSGTGGGGSVTIGSFRYDDKTGGETGGAGLDSRFCAAVYGHLSITGLLYRGVDVH
jgi:hypothetical protein